MKIKNSHMKNIYEVIILAPNTSLLIFLLLEEINVTLDSEAQNIKENKKREMIHVQSLADEYWQLARNVGESSQAYRTSA